MVNYKNKIYGLPLGKKLNFLIPKEIVNNSLFSKHFLRGYFDTDGCLYLEKRNNKYYPRVEMASISKPFINQMRLILTNLGFRFSIYTEKREKYGWNDLHRIIIRGDNMAYKWFSQIKPANPKHIKKYKKVAPPGFEPGTSR